ncbi:hypothetical protein CWE21_07090 [Pseudidiomarina aquimaris]|uniref:Uncharacterized protein n=1 Tax=Pseudidiomarina aquimaris TaxID=641841 RepID=A0A432XG68_9GAMM|nr:hypothetical protein CWE21_07090 [Pseudidiomarina aquimaris]
MVGWVGKAAWDGTKDKDLTVIDEKIAMNAHFLADSVLPNQFFLISIGQGQVRKRKVHHDFWRVHNLHLVKLIACSN